MTRKNILAICGSTRQNSINHSLINSIAHLSAKDINIILYNRIGSLPQFNPDDDDEQVDNEVKEFRRQLDHADGILICTPEYAHGVPGALKNAIDWTVSSSNFAQKPTALITASTDGNYGHTALLETLKAIDAKGVEDLQLVIGFAKTKIGLEGKIKDDETLVKVSILLAGFIKNIYNID